jgi:hypothetical protein
MTDPIYQFRPSLFRKEITYRVTDQALAWDEAATSGALPFADIRQVRTYESPGVSGIPSSARCIVRPMRGRARVLTSNHFVSFGNIESRAESFRPFVDTFVKRVAAANPQTVFISGMPMGLWVTWIVLLAALLVVTPLALLLLVIAAFRGEEISAGFIASAAICLGMLLGFFPLLRLVRRNRPRRFDPRSEGG